MRMEEKIYNEIRTCSLAKKIDECFQKKSKISPMMQNVINQINEMKLLLERHITY